MHDPEDDLEQYESAQELNVYREYRDVVGLFRYIVETERRFYLANSAKVEPQSTNGDVYFEIELEDAWVWDIYRPTRFIKSAKILSFRDVNIEQLPQPEDLDESIFPGPNN